LAFNSQLLTPGFFNHSSSERLRYSITLPVAVLVYHKIEGRDNEEQGRKDGSVSTQVE
jgi:hypothetical protein